MGNEKTLKYFNNKQQEVMAVAANELYFVGPRGFGKSEGIDAVVLIRCTFAMPRSSGAIISPTFAKLLQNTLPAVFHALDRLGYKRNVHYFVGRKAPKAMNFKEPYINPFSYEHVIHWFNGSIQHMISFDRPMSANSMNLDYILCFEAKYLSYDKLKTEVMPANRGNRNYFGDCPWHHLVLASTDMPTQKSGMWIHEKEKEMDEELIQVIKHTYSEYYELKHLKNQKPYHIRRRNELYRDMNLLRAKAVHYMEPTIWDNIEILGEEWVRKMKRDLPALIFQTAILNKRLRKIANGFYAALNENAHTYEPISNAHYLDSLDYDLKKAALNDCRSDSDIDTTKALIVTLDYNASICNMITGQVVDRTAPARRSSYVKTPKKIQELVQEWCNYYSTLTNRDVIYYYDSTAIAASADGNATPFYEIVISKLQANGWNVKAVYIGQPRAHHKKHLDIDYALKGDPRFLFPLFNKHKCEYLLVAMDQTGVKMGRNGFEKDKGPEHLPDSPDSPDEFKTHVTDAWDTFFIGVNEYPVSIEGSYTASFFT